MSASSRRILAVYATTTEGQSVRIAEHRQKQAARNPLASNPGVLDTVLELWIWPHGQGLRDYHAARGSGRWRLPTTDQILDMAKDRGNATVKAYLSARAGMAQTLASVDEYGERGEFWTSTAATSCGMQYILRCFQTVSTNNAYVRALGVSSSEPKFFSFLVSPLDGSETARYELLWR